MSSMPTTRTTPLPRTPSQALPTSPLRPLASTIPSFGTPSPSPPRIPSDGPRGATEEAQLVRVVDGDTIRALIEGVEYRVRYIGMDTPETVKPNSPVQEFGPEATAANERLLAGGSLVLERDVSQTDRFGRLLRYVWVRDAAGAYTFVNLELVRLGFAQVATYPPDVRYVDDYLAAQREAREAGRGLWGSE